MNTFKLKDWHDISVKQFYNIRDIMEEPDEYSQLNLLDIIYDIDSANLTLPELSKYNNALEFLSKDIPVVNLKDTYTINGTEYKSGYNLTELTAAQFVDYQNYAKESSDRWENFLSVVFIPVGHKYNDGYSISKVKEDLLTMPITVVKSLVFFYTIQFEAFLHHFLSSLKQTVKKMKLPKNQEKEILENLNKADLVSLESFLLSLPTAKKQ